MAIIVTANLAGLERTVTSVSLNQYNTVEFDLYLIECTIQL